MKVGVRKPNVKKSIAAKTTGKIKRQVKKSINPLYGQKGMGVISNPKKAAYNAIYDKTTIGVGDILNRETSTSNAPIDSVSSGNIFSTIGLFFSLLFNLLKLGFWIAVIIAILAFMIWLF